MKDYPEKTSEHYGGVWNEAEAIQQGSRNLKFRSAGQWNLFVKPFPTKHRP